uniref:Uncharacterized protein n=1 Tax=Toxoplasma gondii COUG TaxID=1074873 RepID=A0A2G8Y4U1_TOXGO|nr:hypothetical protein TGCOUG_304700 [Toxoplasma gondii COUG]
MQHLSARLPGAGAPALSPSGALGATVCSFFSPRLDAAGDRASPRACVSERVLEGLQDVEERNASEGSVDGGTSGAGNLELAGGHSPLGTGAGASASAEEDRVWLTFGSQRDSTEAKRTRRTGVSEEGRQVRDAASLVPRERCYGCCASSFFLCPSRPLLEAALQRDGEDDSVWGDVEEGKGREEETQGAGEECMQTADATACSPLHAVAQSRAFFHGLSFSERRNPGIYPGKKKKTNMNSPYAETAAPRFPRLDFSLAKALERLASFQEERDKDLQAGRPLALEPNAPERHSAGVSVLDGVTRSVADAFLREETARALVKCAEAMSENFRCFHEYLRRFCNGSNARGEEEQEVRDERLRPPGLFFDGETSLKADVFLKSAPGLSLQARERKARTTGRRTPSAATHIEGADQLRDRERLLASYALRHRDALAATMNYVFELHSASRAHALSAGDPAAEGEGQAADMSPKREDNVEVTAALESLRLAVKAWDIAIISLVLPSGRRRFNLMEWQRLWLCRVGSFSTAGPSASPREEDIWADVESLVVEEQDGAWTHADAVNVAWRLNKRLCRFLCRADFSSWLAACDRLGLQNVPCLLGLVAAVQNLQRVSTLDGRDSGNNPASPFSREAAGASQVDENFEAAVASARATAARVVFLFVNTATPAGMSNSEAPLETVGEPPLSAFSLGPEEQRAWGLLSLSLALMVGNVTAPVAAVFDVSEAFLSSQTDVFPFSFSALTSSHSPLLASSERQASSNLPSSPSSHFASSSSSVRRRGFSSSSASAGDGWACALLQESFISSLFWSLFPSVSLHSQFLFFLRANAPTLLALQAQDDPRGQDGEGRRRGDECGGLGGGGERGKGGGELEVCVQPERDRVQTDHCANVDLAAFDLDAADRLVLALWRSQGHPEGTTQNGALQLLHLLVEDAGLASSFPPFFFAHIVDLLFLADAFAPLPPGVAAEARCDIVMEYGASLLAHNQVHASVPYLQEAARVPALVPAVLDLLRRFLASSVHAFSDFRDRAASLQDLELPPPPPGWRAAASDSGATEDAEAENKSLGGDIQSFNSSLDPCAILLHGFSQACGLTCVAEAQRALSSSGRRSSSLSSHTVPASAVAPSSAAAGDEESERALLLLRDSFCFLLFRARRRSRRSSLASYPFSPSCSSEGEDEEEREECAALQRQMEALDRLLRRFCRLGTRHCACLLAALSGDSSPSVPPAEASTGLTGLSPSKSSSEAARLLEASLRAVAAASSSAAVDGFGDSAEGTDDACDFGRTGGEGRQKRRRIQVAAPCGTCCGGQDPTECAAEETEGRDDLDLLDACARSQGIGGDASLPSLLVFLALYAKRRPALERFLRRHDANDSAWLHTASSLMCLREFIVPGFVALVAFVGSPQVSPSIPAFFLGCLLFDALRLLRLCSTSPTLIGTFKRRNLSLLSTSWRRCLDAILLQTTSDEQCSGIDWRSPELQRTMVNALVLAESRCVA